MHKKTFKCFKGEKWNLELAEKTAADFRRVETTALKPQIYRLTVNMYINPSLFYAFINPVVFSTPQMATGLEKRTGKK